MQRAPLAWHPSWTGYPQPAAPYHAPYGYGYPSSYGYPDARVGQYHPGALAPQETEFHHWAEIIVSAVVGAVVGVVAGAVVGRMIQ